MTIWYTADMHFGHEDAMGFCSNPLGQVHDNCLGSRNAVKVGVAVRNLKPVSFKKIAEHAAELPQNKHYVDLEPGVAER